MHRDGVLQRNGRAQSDPVQGLIRETELAARVELQLALTTQHETITHSLTHSLTHGKRKRLHADTGDVK